MRKKMSKKKKDRKLPTAKCTGTRAKHRSGAGHAQESVPRPAMRLHIHVSTQRQTSEEERQCDQALSLFLSAMVQQILEGEGSNL